MIRKILARTRSLYKSHPALYSIIELSLFLGLYFFNIWVAPFWFWGIYRLNIPLPHAIDKVFLSLWHISPHLAVPSIIVGLSFLVFTLSVRKDPLRELGIRFDNLKSSGRECTVAFLISTSLILIVFLFHLEDFISYSPKHYYWLFLYPFWGIVQQFWLQSIMFVRFLQILKNKNLAILAAAVIFSLLHAPKIPFVMITFIAGLCCCILFSRHRNIFTLGIFHAVMAAMAYALLVPSVLNNFTPGPIPGQWKNNTEFIAHIRYEGSTIVAKPSDIITIPIGIENKGAALWDSHEQQYPVYVSYHLLDAAGNMIVFDTVRTPFPSPIRPGESRRVDLIVTVPPGPGRYQLEIDIVKERLTWFKNKGSLTIYIPLVVSHGENQPFRTSFEKKSGNRLVLLKNDL
jgi:hypothetical protein